MYLYYPAGNFYSIVYALVFVVGCALLALAYWQFQKTEKLLLTGKKSEAQVVKMNTHRDNDGDLMYTPVFEYTDENHQPHTYTYEVSSSPATWDVGEKADVVYNPANDKEIKIVTYWGLYRWVTIPLIVGVSLIIISIGYYLYLWHVKPD